MGVNRVAGEREGGGEPRRHAAVVEERRVATDRSV